VADGRPEAEVLDQEPAAAGARVPAAHREAVEDRDVDRPEVDDVLAVVPVARETRTVVPEKIPRQDRLVEEPCAIGEGRLRPVEAAEDGAADREPREPIESLRRTVGPARDPDDARRTGERERRLEIGERVLPARPVVRADRRVVDVDDLGRGGRTRRPEEADREEVERSCAHVDLRAARRTASPTRG
jgi:hypothetical protein